MVSGRVGPRWWPWASDAVALEYLEHRRSRGSPSDSWPPASDYAALLAPTGRATSRISTREDIGRRWYLVPEPVALTSRHAMILYTCPARTHGANAPLVKHPCGVAAKALDAAGQTYKVKVVGGFKNLPFSRRGKRQEIIDLTGQQDVPVLVTDDGSIIAGSQAIVAWARGLRPA